MMLLETIAGVLIPFLGTTLGAMCVFFIGGKLSAHLQKLQLGVAAGVMTAASVWSLIIPAIDMSSHMGYASFVPAAIGFACGTGFLMLSDKLIPKFAKKTEKFGKSFMMLFAVTLHNIPEGMAVGVIFAGMAAPDGVGVAAAFALSIGIAIQNFPEGAIVSMPLAGGGMKKGRAFGYGALSGVVEPIAAILTILLSRIVVPALPYLLAFAAGAMIYVVIKELVPESMENEGYRWGLWGFTVGFLIMMILDVVFG